MGWFDGNPAHLWEHPPVERRERYVEFMGGAERGRSSRPATPSTEGDYRWVAEVVNHLVFAEPEQRGGAGAAGRSARAARLRSRERDLAELLPGRRRRSCATGITGTPSDTRAPAILARLSIAQILDGMKVRLERATRLGQAPDDRLAGDRPRRAPPAATWRTASSGTGPGRRARRARSDPGRSSARR